MAWRFPDNYPDSAHEGMAFRKLITTVDPGISFPEKTTEYQHYLDEISRTIAARQTYKKPLPYIDRFFEKILIPGGYEIERFVEIWPVEKVLDYQNEYAPMCNMESDLGFLQFGSWTGDYGDGNAWCLDLIADEIVCLPASADVDDRKTARASTYANLPNFGYFVAYLASAAVQRGWVSHFNLTHEGK